MDLLRFVPLIAAIACPLGMGLMMWLMHRQMNGPAPKLTTGQNSTNPSERLAVLRDQRAALDAEIAATAQMVDLENQRARLLAPPAGPQTEGLPKVGEEQRAVREAAG